MNQDASSEMEELAAGYRLLNERCRRLQAQKEEHLQQAISTYETDRAAGQDEIKKKELALQELEAEYKEELRVKKEALQTALQREVTRKRKHDAEVQDINQQLTDLKRLKQSNLELSVRSIPLGWRGVDCCFCPKTGFPAPRISSIISPNLTIRPQIQEGVTI